MPYLGKSPTQGVRQRYQYTATAGQTTFSGTDSDNLTLTYTDANFVDVYQNGVLLKGGGTDYTATTGTSVVLTTGASVSDVIEIIVYDVFAVANHVKKSGDIMTGQLQISTTDNSTGLLLESSDADANDAPIIDLYRNSASPADNDDIGQIQFSGQNDAGEKIMYASMFAEMPDVSDGTEDGAIAFNLEKGGSLLRMVKFGTNEHVFNTNGLDIDFRVRSDNNDHMLFVDAGNDHVNIGTSSDLGSTLNVNGEITCANANAGLLLVENAADAFGSNFTMRKSRNTTLNAHTVVQDDDVTGNINFQGSDGDEFLSTASIASAVDGTPGNNDMPGRLVFSVTADGASSPTEAVRIEEDGHFLIGQADDQGGHKFLVYEGVNDNAAIFRSGASDFSETSVTINANRTNSDIYDLLVMGSNNGGDNEFLFAGDGDGFADGSFSGGGADYAEYFEWKDGNSSGEDRVGISVKLDGDKIVASSDSDNASDIIGVISANPTVTGDGANLKWNNKYLVDDYGRYIREEYTATEWTEVKIHSNGSRQEKHHVYETDKIPSDVTVPSDAKVISKEGTGAKLTRRKLNPDYDASKTYVPRPKRKEWDAVGLMGKLRMKKGQKTGANWIKMRDISDTVEEWLVR